MENRDTSSEERSSSQQSFRALSLRKSSYMESLKNENRKSTSGVLRVARNDYCRLLVPTSSPGGLQEHKATEKGSLSMNREQQLSGPQASSPHQPPSRAQPVSETQIAIKTMSLPEAQRLNGAPRLPGRVSPPTLAGSTQDMKAQNATLDIVARDLARTFNRVSSMRTRSPGTSVAAAQDDDTVTLRRKRGSRHSRRPLSAPNVPMKRVGNSGDQNTDGNAIGTSETLNVNQSSDATGTPETPSVNQPTHEALGVLETGTDGKTQIVTSPGEQHAPDTAVQMVSGSVAPTSIDETALVTPQATAPPSQNVRRHVLSSTEVYMRHSTSIELVGEGDGSTPTSNEGGDEDVFCDSERNSYGQYGSSQHSSWRDPSSGVPMDERIGVRSYHTIVKHRESSAWPPAFFPPHEYGRIASSNTASNWVGPMPSPIPLNQRNHSTPSSNQPNLIWVGVSSPTSSMSSSPGQGQSISNAAMTHQTHRRWMTSPKEDIGQPDKSAARRTERESPHVDRSCIPKICLGRKSSEVG